MIIYNKDILSVTRGLICHGVNCQGVMGAGLALQIRNKWPQVYESYRKYISDAKSKTPNSDSFLGDCITAEISDQLLVVNCFTQVYYGNHKPYYSLQHFDYLAFDTILNFLFELSDTWSLPLCFPEIGCGLAGGNWKIVSQMIETKELMFNQIYDNLPEVQCYKL